MFKMMSLQQLLATKFANRGHTLSLVMRKGRLTAPRRGPAEWDCLSHKAVPSHDTSHYKLPRFTSTDSRKGTCGETPDSDKKAGGTPSRASPQKGRKLDQPQSSPTGVTLTGVHAKDGGGSGADPKEFTCTLVIQEEVRNGEVCLKSFSTAAGLKMHVAKKHKEVAMSRKQDMSFPCTFLVEVGPRRGSKCLCAFPTKLGLSVHVGSKHKASANVAKQVAHRQKVRIEWTDQSVTFLMKLEATWTHNKSLVGTLPRNKVEAFCKFAVTHPMYEERTLESLKRVRLRAGYKDGCAAEVKRLKDVYGSSPAPVAGMRPPPITHGENELRTEGEGTAESMEQIRSPHANKMTHQPLAGMGGFEIEEVKPDKLDVSIVGTRPLPVLSVLEQSVIDLSSGNDTFFSCGEGSPTRSGWEHIKLERSLLDDSIEACVGMMGSTPRKKEGNGEDCMAAIVGSPIMHEGIVLNDTPGSRCDLFAAPEEFVSITEDLDRSQREEDERMDPLVHDRLALFKHFFELRRSKLIGLWDPESPSGINTSPAAIDDWVKTRIHGKPVKVPKGGKGKEAKENPALDTLSEGRKRKLMTKRTRELWTANPAACIKSVMDDQVVSVDNVKHDDKIAFWSEVFQRKPVNQGEVPVLGDPQRYQSELDLPISDAEITEAFESTNDSSPGFDGVTRETIRSLGKDELWVMCNVFLVAAYTPAEMRKGRVVLIPKVKDPKHPGELRPLTMMSKIVRLFHKILGNRLERLPMSERQKGFKKRDGVCELIYVVDALIRDAKDNCKSIHILFLDVAKAFDTVSHQGLLRVLERKGAPKGIMDYLRKTYSEMKVVLPGENVELTKEQGVMQGDPKAGPEFNHVVDEVYGRLDVGFGYAVTLPATTDSCRSQITVTDSEFADDGWIVSSTREGLTAQAETVVNGFKDFGMSLNASKCAVMSIEWDGRNKTSVVMTEPFLRIDGTEVPMIGPRDSYKYLGLHIGPYGFKLEKFEEKFSRRLSNLTKGRLDPQQKLYGLVTCLIPSAFHTLVLANVSNRVLISFDILIRKAVKKWLHLPRDTSNAFFYANVADGGLGIPSILTRTRRLGKERLSKMTWRGDDQTIKFLLGDGKRLDHMNRLRQDLKIGTFVIGSKASEREAWRDLLYQSVDGKDLSLRGAFMEEKGSRPSPLDLWLKDPLLNIRGGEFVKAVGVRAKSLKTPSRAARGKRADPRCRHDGQIGDLNHIAQHCAIVHGMRVQRHDLIVKSLAKSFRKRGVLVLKEPVIPTSNGNRKPDLVVIKNNDAYILDPIVSSENNELRRREVEKEEKYSAREVTDFVKGKVAEQGGVGGEVKVHGIALSYRGWMLPDTVKLLRGLGVPKRFFAFMALRVLVDTWNMVKCYGNNTARGARRARVGVG